MNVSELLDILEDYDGDAEVLLRTGSPLLPNSTYIIVAVSSDKPENSQPVNLRADARVYR